MSRVVGISNKENNNIVETCICLLRHDVEFMNLVLDAIDNCPQYGDEVVKVEPNLQLPPLQRSGQRVLPLEEASHLRIPRESGMKNFLLHLK